MTNLVEVRLGDPLKPTPEDRTYHVVCDFRHSPFRGRYRAGFDLGWRSRGDSMWPERVR